eukprot:3856536-Rhodomonas_salina.3
MLWFDALATHHPVPSETMGLRICYAMSSTDPRRGPTRFVVLAYAMVLGTCYAVSGTNLPSRYRTCPTQVLNLVATSLGTLRNQMHYKRRPRKNYSGTADCTSLADGALVWYRPTRVLCGVRY